MIVEKDGYNINQLTDTNKVGIDFIQYFYTNWFNNPNIMKEQNIIKSYTKFQYKGEKHDMEKFLEFLRLSKNKLVNIELKNKEIMQSGSRRLDICVTGVFKFENTCTNFCQYFLIVSEPKSPNNWFLQNTILNEI
jgi:hypothetical protein